MQARLQLCLSLTEAQPVPASQRFSSSAYQIACGGKKGEARPSNYFSLAEMTIRKDYNPFVPGPVQASNKKTSALNPRPLSCRCYSSPPGSVGRAHRNVPEKANTSLQLSLPPYMSPMLSVCPCCDDATPKQPRRVPRVSPSQPLGSKSGCSWGGWMWVTRRALEGECSPKVFVASRQGPARGQG